MMGMGTQPLPLVWASRAHAGMSLDGRTVLWCEWPGLRAEPVSSLRTPTAPSAPHRLGCVVGHGCTPGGLGPCETVTQARSLLSCHSQSPSESRDNALSNWIDPLDTPSKHMISATWARLTSHWASLVAQMVKCLPAIQKTWIRSLGQEDPLEKEMATHSSTLAWKILWMERSGRPWGRKESDMTE